VEIVTSDAHDVVAAVGRGVVDGFVLAHERDGDLRCQATEGARVGAEVQEMPGSGVGEAGLWMDKWEG
jgi:phage head maturation protease